jgi:hypothetical protein
MSESLVGLIDPATRHAVVSIGGVGPGGSKVPAGTMAAMVMVVFGNAKPERLSQVAATTSAPYNSGATIAAQTAATEGNPFHCRFNDFMNVLQEVLFDQCISSAAAL